MSIVVAAARKKKRSYSLGKTAAGRRRNKRAQYNRERRAMSKMARDAGIKIPGRRPGVKRRKAAGGKRGRKVGFSHSPATRKKISAALKRAWKAGKFRGRKMRIKKVRRARRS